MKVTIICIVTLCGRIGPGILGTRLDRLRLEKARAASDASILGAGTLREGEPEMRIEGRVLPHNRLRAIVTKSGKIPLDKKMFKHGPRPIIYTSREGLERLSHKAANLFDIVPVSLHPSGGIDLGNVLEDLEKRGAESVLIEGGGKLNHSALRQGVVDELLITIAPRIHGEIGVPSLVDGTRPAGAPFVELRLVECEPQDSSELFLRYRVINHQENLAWKNRM